MKVLASTASRNDDASRSDTVSSDEEESTLKNTSDFWPVLEEMKRDNQFGQVEIAALRLATAMKNTKLAKTLADYRNNRIEKEAFKCSILDVADRVIKERW